ncbi:Beta-scruin like protein [Argiope bruennichi]|uniref:Beta-scruin like protein n=1 Tax=Argiope bruennichi TaxID=94029 RepID=A0A8T0FSI3_ARGBR|nr:Beta-scruin like protein [Argiope bruennichi]
MYTGQLKVTCQDLSDVYRSARKLGMKGAMKECIELLHVTTEDFQNMVYLYVTARQLKQWECTNRAFRLLVISFERLVMTKQFLDLEVEQILELFSSDELGARSEVIVFLAALKWINHKYMEREEYIVPVFDRIRFHLMSKEEIMACYHPPILPGIVKIPEVKQSLLNATCYIVAKSLGQENLFSDLKPEPRRFLFQGEPMILWDLCMYEPDKFEVNRRNHAATKIQAAVRGYLTRKHLRECISIAHCAAVVIQSAFRGYRVRKRFKMGRSQTEDIGDSLPMLPENRKENMNKAHKETLNKILCLESCFKRTDKSPPEPTLYVMGGCSSDIKEKGQNVIFKYDLSSKIWSVVTSTPIPLHDTRMVATDEALYVLGGCNPLDDNPLPLKESYKFVFKNEEWLPLPLMNNARSLHAAVIFNNLILIIGGKDEENKILSSIEKYDASKNKWEEFTPLPEPRMAMGAVSCKDALWVAGGITSVGDNISLVDSIWCLETKKRKWFKSFKLPKPLAFATLLCDGEQLVCVGGAVRVRKGDTYILESQEDTYRLDAKKDTKWKKDSPMPLKCHNTVASVSDGNIYVLGGFSTETMTQITDALYFDKKEERWFPFSDVPKTDAGFMIAMCKKA